MPGDPNLFRAPWGRCCADRGWGAGGDAVAGPAEEALGAPGRTGRVTGLCLPEIQSKRQERKRRSTANPAYSGLLETEVRPPALCCGEGLPGWPPSPPCWAGSWGDSK